MVSVSKIREELGQLLANRVSLRAFEDWFVSVRQEIHKNASPEAKDLAFAIDDAMSQFDEDSAAFRQALLEAWFSVQEPIVFANRSGDVSAIAESNAELAVNCVGA